MFIFDQQRHLRYEGRIDNNIQEKLVTKRYARDAIDALLAGKSVAITDTPAVGCSTKWAYKEKGARAEIDADAQQPVTVGSVSADQLKALAQNKDTGKLLLVNFWATWCGPCTEEFPEIQKMVRQYAKRALNIVTISINDPDEKSFVLKFLNEQHAINRNLLWSTNDSTDAVKAFGTGWSGGVDYVTHDVLKFFNMLLKRNGYVLEQLYSPLVVAASPEHEELKPIATRCITRHHVHHYLGFADTQWKLFDKESPPRVKPLLYVYRVLLTGIHLMQTGEVEANLVNLNANCKLPFIPDLITRKTSGREHEVLNDTEKSFHQVEFERLRSELENAGKESKLPEEAEAKADLNDLLLRIRMAGISQGTGPCS